MEDQSSWITSVIRLRVGIEWEPLANWTAGIYESTRVSGGNNQAQPMCHL